MPSPARPLISSPSRRPSIAMCLVLTLMGGASAPRPYGTSCGPPDVTPVSGRTGPLERLGETSAAPDSQLAVHVRQVDLDRLGGHVERAGDVAVALAPGRQLRHPPLAGRQRPRARERLVPRAATRGVELVPSMLGQRLRAAMAGDLERLSQRRPCVGRPPGEP